MTTSSWPKLSVLRRGIILRSVLNAILITEHDDYARLLSWDGKNYVLNNLDGKYAAVVFEVNDAVAVFFDLDSPNNPLKSREHYDAKRFFSGMPTSLQRLADEALRFNRQTFQGNLVSLVTAAFWSQGEYVNAAVPWEEVFANGAHIIRIELIEDLDTALKEWQESYQCSPERLALARSLFERRASQPANIPIVLSESEVESLATHSANKVSLADCLKALKQMGIIAPR